MRPQVGTHLAEMKSPLNASVLRGGFFFLDIFVDQTRHAATAEAARRFILRFPLRIAHEASVEGFFRADEVVVVKG